MRSCCTASSVAPVRRARRCAGRRTLGCTFLIGSAIDSVRVLTAAAPAATTVPEPGSLALLLAGGLAALSVRRQGATPATSATPADKATPA